MTYKTSAFVFMASLGFALGIMTVLHVASNTHVRSDQRVAENSDLASAELSRVRLVISSVK
jgi:hypothetical protein